MKAILVAIFSLLVFDLPSYAQERNKTSDGDREERPWKNKRAAVVLTYDDGLNVHLTNAIPALDSVGIRGTFYISDNSGGLQRQLLQWKTAASKGHELANHTVYHPCTGGLPGREFVKADYDLNNYTVRRITDEIRTMNTLLKAIDGKTKRTFAFPCNDTRIRDTPYLSRISNDFIGVRAVRAEMPTLQKVDLLNLPSYMINGETGDQLISLVKQAMANKTLLIFLFHGVGGEHALNVSLKAHTELLQFLKQQENDLWVVPMIEVAEYISVNQTRQSKVPSNTNKN